MKVRPNTEIFSILRLAPTGLVGTLTLGWVNAETGDAVGVASTSGITEIAEPSGNYTGTLTTPADEGLYIPQWINVDVEVLDDIVYEVLVDAPLEELDLPYSYASRSDLDTYLEDGLPAGYTDLYLDKVLAKASADVDFYSTAIYVEYTNHLKFAPIATPTLEWDEDVTTPMRAAIIEATCAQAEYRLAKGDQFFVEAHVGGTRRSAEGLRVNVSSEPRFAPKAVEALRRGGMAVRLVFATAR